MLSVIIHDNSRVGKRRQYKSRGRGDPSEHAQPGEAGGLLAGRGLWIALLLPMALLLYRPTDRVNTILAPVLFLVPLVVFAAVANSPILMLPAIFGVLALLALALHPAGRSLFHFDRVERVNRGLAAVMVVAAIPLLVFAGDQVVRQLTAADDHALFVHFAGMAIAATYVVVMGALAVTRERDWEFAAWSAGLVAVVIGAASILFAVESSVGPVWGALSGCPNGSTTRLSVQAFHHANARRDEPDHPDGKREEVRAVPGTPVGKEDVSHEQRPRDHGEREQVPAGFQAGHVRPEERPQGERFVLSLSLRSPRCDNRNPFSDDTADL